MKLDGPIRVEWSRVASGERKEHGWEVHGIGFVFGGDTEIELAKSQGGDPLVELHDRTSASSYIPQLVIGTMVPRDRRLVIFSEMKSARKIILSWFFDKYIENPAFEGSIFDCASVTGIDSSAASLAWKELIRQGLLQKRSSGTAGDTSEDYASITGKGLDTLEGLLRYPDDSLGSDGVMVNQTNNIHNSNVAGINSGTGYTASNQQSIGISSSDLSDIIVTLRENLFGAPDSEEAIQVIEDEIKNPNPRMIVIKNMFSVLKSGVSLLNKSPELLGPLHDYLTLHIPSLIPHISW